MAQAEEGILRLEKKRKCEARKRNFKDRRKMLQEDFYSILLDHDLSASFWATGAASSWPPTVPPKAFSTHCQ